MQLLISVKNVDEALLAMDASADLIDLKDPSIGALTALDLTISEEIVRAINGRAHVSGTVGEVHASLDDLLRDIQARVDLGLYAIKMCVTPLFTEANFVREMRRFTASGVKLIAVFFADSAVDLTLLSSLQQAGFYGAMLDMQNKQFSLLEAQTAALLKKFIHDCAQYQLVSGLAGSLKPQHVEFLLELNSTFIGFRGGVCENFDRKSTISTLKIEQIKKMLLKHNKTGAKALKSLVLALHN